MTEPLDRVREMLAQPEEPTARDALAVLADLLEQRAQDDASTAAAYEGLAH